MDDSARPTLAEYARTALAQASVGTLATSGHAGEPGTLTVVTVEDQTDARPVVHLEETSPVLRTLSKARTATLSVAGGEQFRSVDLIGLLMPCRSELPGQRSFRISPLTVRLVGGTPCAIHPNDFQRARPDPLADLAPAFLQHLRYAHSTDLFGWVQAHGFEQADAVVPLRLDRYGIDVTVLSPSGVHSVRLAHPDGPIESLDQMSLPLSMSPRCRDHESDIETDQ